MNYIEFIMSYYIQFEFLIIGTSHYCSYSIYRINLTKNNINLTNNRVKQFKFNLKNVLKMYYLINYYLLSLLFIIIYQFIVLYLYTNFIIY